MLAETDSEISLRRNFHVVHGIKIRPSFSNMFAKPFSIAETKHGCTTPKFNLKRELKIEKKKPNLNKAFIFSKKNKKNNDSKTANEQMF